MANNNLPHELMIEIFSKLPTKSVGKCRCLSKSWNSHLSTQQFIKLHLTRKNQQESLILITPSRSLLTISPPIQNYTVSNTIQLHNNWTHVVGSCNGLVLLLNKDDQLFLINPVTCQQVYIPDSDLALNKAESFRMHGFGYDTCTDDYKIVTLSYYDTDNEIEPDCVDTFVDVYSVKLGVWKRVECSPYDHAVPLLATGAFVNGAIHWLATSRQPGDGSVIAAFDLNREVFREIPAPRDLDTSKFVFNRLVVLCGRLCVVDDFDRSTTDIWTMEEYGLDESWVRLLVYCEKDKWDVVKPLSYIGDDELVLATEDETLVVYNVGKGTNTDMIVDGVRATLIDAGMFVDSLVVIG